MAPTLSRRTVLFFVGDPGARPSGSVAPVRNLDGFVLRRCGATFVATIWFELN